MDFYELWRCASNAEKKQIAKDLQTSVSYCSRLAHGRQAPGKFFQQHANKVLGGVVIFRGGGDATS